MRHPSRRGMILLVVLVVIALCSLAALTFSSLMTAEREAVNAAVRKVQARALADSGLEMARMFLGLTPDEQISAGGTYDNTGRFQGVLVADSPIAHNRGRFAIVAPRVEDGIYQGIRFGLEDESTKLNLNILAALDQKLPGCGRQILSGLPGMTDDVADAILDWIDQDDEPREFGAELDSYQMLDPPYATANGPLCTVEDLLLVRGVTPSLLFGVDVNHNAMADQGEPSPQGLGVDNSDRSMDRGWAAYVTLYSMESNFQPDGVTPRINLNQSDMEKLYSDLTAVLPEQWATFIVAYRQNGPYTDTSGSGSGASSGTGSGTGGTAGQQQPAAAGASTGQLDLTQQGKVNITQVIELLGQRVRVQFQGASQPTTLESPFPYDPNSPSMIDAYLPELLDYVTASPNKLIAGRININQAPRVVLKGIPGMTPEIVDQILTQREPDPARRDPAQRYETWILSKGIVPLEEMKLLCPFITGGGCIYRAQAVGYYDGEGPSARIEAIIHAGTQPPRVIFWRDMSHLGRGYPREVLGVETFVGE